jgi:hypothetical protein
MQLFNGPSLVFLRYSFFVYSFFVILTLFCPCLRQRLNMILAKETSWATLNVDKQLILIMAQVIHRLPSRGLLGRLPLA